MTRLLQIAGDVTLFGLRAVTDLPRRPFEGDQIRRQLAEVGSRSLPLVVVSGFALGAVMTLHTRSTLVMFGATAWIPTVQALGFFLEIGPLVTGLLVAGRVGSGIAAVLSNMRATEQIDAIANRPPLPSVNCQRARAGTIDVRICRSRERSRSNKSFGNASDRSPERRARPSTS
jgi:ABC-type transporter Mla maintaining outer membrane lipid asymmetry permease subunit MlaE